VHVEKSAPVAVPSAGTDLPSPPPPKPAVGLGNIGTIGTGSGEGVDGGRGFGGGRARASGAHATIDADDVRRAEDQSGATATDEEATTEQLLEQPQRGGRWIVRIEAPGRVRRPCSKAADLPFFERQRLWAERLTPLAGDADAMSRAYRAAIGDCELPTVRERTAFARIALSLLPEIATKVRLHRLLLREPLVADAIYRAILVRVVTQDDLRALHAALGLATADPGEVERALAKAASTDERIAVLERYADRHPQDRSLQIGLLFALDDAGREGAALALGRRLLRRSDADALVRTAVGQLFLDVARRPAKNGVTSSDAELEREGLRAFGELVEFSPEDPVARRRLGDLLRAYGFHAEAERQYETLAKLSPDDPSVALLLASAAQGLGKLEEAVRWTEKGARAGAPDASQGPHVTARALAATWLAWGKLDARRGGREDEATALDARRTRLMADERRAGGTRVVLTWLHPDLHPTLWTDAGGRLAPAPEGDPSLGVAQSIAPVGPLRIEVRVDESELAQVRSSAAKLVLTVVSDEGGAAEVVHREEIAAPLGARSVFVLEGATLRRSETDDGATGVPRAGRGAVRGAGR
jgi:Ca-activated chloride channel family protein